MEQNLTELVTHLVLQLAVIFMAAKVGGEICGRYLKIPAVLGELGVGILIGPFALGGVAVLGYGPLFPLAHDGAAVVSLVPISSELWAIAQIASIVLLFVVGLETNLRLFLKYIGPGSLVAVGGIVLPFLFGAVATVVFGFAESIGSPAALFMGAILTATSVGITARVLSDIRKLDTPEGVTVLAAAVVDDVMAILVLTVVVGISASGQITTLAIAGVALKAVLFWFGLMAISLLLSRSISRWINRFKMSGAQMGLALSLAFLAAGLSEMFGLALIIGAYSIGLALSHTDLARKLEEPLQHVYNALVPVFFVVMGMLVDIPAMFAALWFGIIITILAAVGKVVGSGLPALGTGFTRIGAWRIGVGMMPRGEVALIIAGIGLAEGIIGQNLFGVCILMTIVTTILAPIILVPSFIRGGSGRRLTDHKEQRV